MVSIKRWIYQAVSIKSWCYKTFSLINFGGKHSTVEEVTFIITGWTSSVQVNVSVGLEFIVIGTSSVSVKLPLPSWLAFCDVSPPVTVQSVLYEGGHPQIVH